MIFSSASRCCSSAFSSTKAMASPLPSWIGPGHLKMAAIRRPSSVVVAVMAFVDLDAGDGVAMTLVRQRVELAVAAILAGAVDELASLDFPRCHGDLLRLRVSRALYPFSDLPTLGGLPAMLKSGRDSRSAGLSGSKHRRESRARQDCVRAPAFLDARAAAIGDFSNPIFQFDYTLMVPAASSIAKVADADRPGVCIAVVRNHASTNELVRQVKQAELVYAEMPEARSTSYATAKPMSWPRAALCCWTFRLYCGPVLRHPAGPIQAANFRLAITF